MNYYVLITILVLAVIFIALLSGSKRNKRFTKLNSLSIIFIIFGIIAGAALSDKVFAYTLFGFGVIFAVLDLKSKPKQ